MYRLLVLAVWFHVAFGSFITVRQVSSNPAPSASVDCATYSHIANLSTISSNSTYRAAFLRSTSDGTLRAATILNGAQKVLPLLIGNTTLNEQCGNASAIAITEAANNFTNGIVAEFKILPAVGTAVDGAAGLITLYVVMFIVFLMGGMWSAL